MRSAETVATMLCPVCRTGLTLADRAGVEIDYCPSCRGVWLDRGELDKILERSSAPPPPRREPERYRPDHYADQDDRRHRYPKRKSFLSELFD